MEDRPGPCSISGSRLSIAQELEPGKAYSITNAQTVQTARDESEVNGGIWYAGRDYIVHQVGRNTTTYIHVDAVDRQRRARGLVQRLTGDDCAGKWTSGQLCRLTLRWIDADDREYTEAAARGLAASGWAFRHVQPGVYEYGALYDKGAAYWHILGRMPTYLCEVTKHGPIYRNGKPQCEERWRLMVEALSSNKQLRNSLVGCMAGGSGLGTYHAYAKGKAINPKMPQNKRWFDAASVIVRSNYELTQCEFNRHGAHAIYANSDSVAVTDPLASMQYWDDYQIPYSIVTRGGKDRAQGYADIRMIGAYKIGTYQTLMYDTSTDYSAMIAKRLEYPTWHYWLNREGICVKAA